MKKILLYGFFVIGLSLMVSASDAQGQVLSEILSRMDAHNKNLTSLQANVTMVKTNIQLGESDTFVGFTSYLPKTAKRGVYMRLDWTTKPVEQISLIGDDYELYKPSINQLYFGKVAKAKNSASVGGALSFLNMSREQLRANFNTSYLGQESVAGGILTFHLELKPKSQTSYKIAELWVDGDGMPRQAKIVEQNNDTTIVSVSNPQKNVTIKADIFKLNAPKTVKRIQA